MPRYDYYCPGCGKVVERELTFEQKEELGTKYRSVCEEINEVIEMEQVFHVPSIHYKGMGFFSTDHVDSLERHERDHYDGSGRNSDKKLRDRRQKHAS
jgi:predicted nucleic acid-binding Zn ribbon protein